MSDNDREGPAAHPTEVTAKTTRSPQINSYKFTKQRTMKSKTFEIPQDQLVEFSEELIDSALDNQITGVDQENETITVEVSYDLFQRPALYGLLEWVEDHIDLDDE